MKKSSLMRRYLLPKKCFDQKMEEVELTVGCVQRERQIEKE